MDPGAWLGYFPAFIINSPYADAILNISSSAQIVLAIWIISDKKIFIPSAVAAFFLLGLIIVDFDQFEVLFRDVSLFLVAVALAVWSYDDIPLKI